MGLGGWSYKNRPIPETPDWLKKIQEDYRRRTMIPVTPEMIEIACRAHWPTWDRMRPDHQRKWRAKMAEALKAALNIAVARP